MMTRTVAFVLAMSFALALAVAPNADARRRADDPRPHCQIEHGVRVCR